jgi:hypothetical protein
MTQIMTGNTDGQEADSGFSRFAALVPLAMPGYAGRPMIILPGLTVTVTGVTPGPRAARAPACLRCGGPEYRRRSSRGRAVLVQCEGDAIVDCGLPWIFLNVAFCQRLAGRCRPAL